MNNTQSMNIYMKVIELRKCITEVEKDGKGHRGAKFIKTDSVISQIKDKMNELYILLQPEVGPLTHELVSYQSYDKDARKEVTKTKWDVSGEMKYVWIDAENPSDRIEVPWHLFGQGDDSSKAYGSGLSYSERYFLVKYFNLAEEKDQGYGQNSGSNGYQNNQYYNEPPPSQNQNQNKGYKPHPKSEPIKSKNTKDEVKEVYAEYTGGDLSNFEPWYGGQKLKRRKDYEMVSMLRKMMKERKGA